jgi:cobalt/nickel transport system permease protein
MELILDEYAQKNALIDVSSPVKLLAGLGAILICISSTSPVAPLFIAVSMAFITVIFARIPVRLYLSLLMIPVSFALFSSLIILLMSGGGIPLVSADIGGIPLSITTDSANLALMVITRTFGGMCSLYFIALTTPIIEVFSVMQQCRLPRGLLDLSMLIYHFIFILIGEAISIHTAQLLRHGYDSFKNSLHSFAMLGAMLFIRAWQQGEELIIAMDSRCYDGKLELTGTARKTGFPITAVVFLYLGICVWIAYISAATRIF